MQMSAIPKPKLTMCLIFPSPVRRTPVWPFLVASKSDTSADLMRHAQRVIATTAKLYGTQLASGSDAVSPAPRTSMPGSTPTFGRCQRRGEVVTMSDVN